MSLSKMLINGVPAQSVDAFDRGLAYGDGVFETIKVLKGTPLFLEPHLDRLTKGCQRLGIPFDQAQVAILQQELAQLCLAMTEEQGVAKVIVTRGSGGRGYRAGPDLLPNRLLAISDFPHYPEHYYRDGIELGLCQTRLADNPQLAQIKHLNRLEQVLARAEWQDEYAEAIVRNYQDQVVEGTMSNLFLIKNNCLSTPPIERCGVEGVMRNWVIGQRSALGTTIVEKDLTVKHLQEAEGIFMTNSIIGIWPVALFQKQHFTIHPLCRRLQQLLSAAEDQQLEAQS
ncbi:MAG: aminodeoxychorismate lyase [Motiliproteus sp.]|nr:aminodeoxychorismate lyase [Motiliproteus sp.]MCW9052955.1 aminodeoxychorismate lyase [Motiliproteus sp.]